MENNANTNVTEENIVKIDTGAITVTLVDMKDRPIGSFEFIPTDLDIVKRWEEAVKRFERLEVPAPDDFNGLETFSQKTKELFNYLLNYNVADEMFKVCNPYTVIKDGYLYIENCMDVIAAQIEKTFSSRLKKRQARIQRATSKYTKKKR